MRCIQKSMACRQITLASTMGISPYRSTHDLLPLFPTALPTNAHLGQVRRAAVSLFMLVFSRLGPDWEVSDLRAAVWQPHLVACVSAACDSSVLAVQGWKLAWFRCWGVLFWGLAEIHVAFGWMWLLLFVC